MGLEAEPPARSRGRAPGHWVRTAKPTPPEAETLDFLTFTEGCNKCPLFTRFETQKIKYNLCCLCKKMKSRPNRHNTSQISVLVYINEK